MSAVIRTMERSDWDAVASIYAEGLDTGVASFETVVPCWEDWDAAHLPAPRLVAEQDGAVAGWLAVTPTSRRECYRGVVEHSVYVTSESRGSGVGRALLERLVREAPALGFWTIQTAIIASNAPSLALHAAVGFRQVGRRERIAERDGIWHDTVLLELRLA